jgi:hypothetical protein
MWVPMPVKVKANTKKIYFANHYETLRIDFFNYENNYGSDLLLPGVSELCLCNEAWRENIGAESISVAVDLQVHGLHQKYYLLEVRLAVNGTPHENVQYICALRPHENEYDAYNMMYALQAQVPRVMKTLFYDERDEYLSCKDIASI